MKLSELWTRLILITFALLLSASINEQSATPSNQHNANQTKRTTDDRSTPPAPTTIVTNQAGSTPTNSQSATHDYPAPENWLATFGQIAAIVSAVLLTVFTGGLWWTSVQQWRVIGQSVASDRPYLLVSALNFENESPTLHVEEEGRIVSVEHVPVPVVTFTNYGRTPAIITRALLSFEPFECSDYFPRQHEAHGGWDDRLFEEPLEQQGVPANGTVRFEVLTKFTKGFDISTDLYEELINLERVLIAYGRIEYRDVFGGKFTYTTYFCWILNLMVANGGLFWSVGPLSHNTHT